MSPLKRLPQGGKAQRSKRNQDFMVHVMSGLNVAVAQLAGFTSVFDMFLSILAGWHDPT